METVFEIFFGDLTQLCQRKLLDAYGISDPIIMNWDVFPVVTIPTPRNEDEMVSWNPDEETEEAESHGNAPANGRFIDDCPDDAYDALNRSRID
jgi:hypothetical protein